MEIPPKKIGGIVAQMVNSLKRLDLMSINSKHSTQIKWYASDIMAHTPEQLIRMGYQARREGRLEVAREIFSRSIGMCRAAEDRSLLASSLAGLGQIERDLNNSEAALQHYREAVENYRSGGNRLRLAHTIRHLADILREDGSLERARPFYEEALSLYRQNPETSPLDLANTIRGFALLRGSAGETEEAKALWREARALYESVDVRAGVQESDTQITRLTVK